MEYQKLLYKRYQDDLKNGRVPARLAAKPGYSNHQSGTAVDEPVASNPKKKPWLARNALHFNFVATVKSEDWHFDHNPKLAAKLMAENKDAYGNG